MINEKVKVNKSKLPKLVKNCIEELEYYDKIKDEDMYYATVEVLETTAKSCVLANHMSE